MFGRDQYYQKVLIAAGLLAFVPAEVCSAYVRRFWQKLLSSLKWPKWNYLISADLPVTGQEKSTNKGVSSLVQGIQQRFQAFVTKPKGASKATPQASAKQPSRTEDMVQDFSHVSLQPKDSKWACCSWSISKADQQRAKKLKAKALCLRLVDLYSHADALISRHAIKEILVDSEANEWFLPVPMGGREYLLELGYQLPKGGWLSLAFSEPVYVPQSDPSERSSDRSYSSFRQVQDFASQAFSPTSSVAEVADFGDDGMHEQMYQRAISNHPNPSFGIGSETLQGDGRSDRTRRLSNDSGSGLLDSGRGQFLRRRREAKQNDPDNQPDSDWF